MAGESKATVKPEGPVHPDRWPAEGVIKARIRAVGVERLGRELWVE